MSGTGAAPEAGVVEAAVDVVARRLAWGVGVAASVLAVGAAVVLLSRPVYRADARLRLGDPPPTAGITPTGGLLSFLRTGGDPFANDLELLASRTLAEAVVRRVALPVELQAPRGWHRDSVLVSLSLSDTTVRAVYEVRWPDRDRVAVRRTSPTEEAVGEFRTGEPVVFGGVEAAFAERRPDGPGSVRLKTVPLGDAVRQASGRLDVTRTRRDANVLEIAYTHHDPGVALAVVRSAVDDFLRLRTALFQRESGETVDSLAAVARGTREELRAAEDSLEKLQEETGLVALDPQSEALVERYETARSALEQAEAEVEALDALMARASGVDDPVRRWSVLVAHPRFLENQTVGDLLTRLTELHDRRMEAATRLRPEALDLRNLDGQIASLDGALWALVGEYHASMAGAAAELEDRVSALEEQMGALPSRLVELGRRQREVRVLSEVVVLTEQRLRQEELRQALAFSNVQVVDTAGLRFRPVWPRRKLGLAVVLLLAAASGLLAMAMVERADASVRGAGRIRALGGATVLAAPVGRAGAARLSQDEAAAVRSALREGVLVPCEGVADTEVDGLDPRPTEARGGGPRRVRSFADAAAAAAQGPVVLVVRVGRTPERDVALAARLLAEAGGTVAGTVAVCPDAGGAARLWR